VESKPKTARNGYRERNYRRLIENHDLVSFQVLVKETDLFVQTQKDLQTKAHAAVLNYRYQLERYIHEHPDFFHSLVPLPFVEVAPAIVKEMIQASQIAGVGPMAAVAGAMAEFVGRDLLSESAEVIVENGGDIFIQTPRNLKIGIFAGLSPLSLRIGLRVSRADKGLGVCTSSGTVGPSLSFGRADAVCVLAPSASLADAAATAIGNVVKSPGDSAAGLETAQAIAGIRGVVIIIGEKMGAWGEVELIEMEPGIK
jgi:hypothetical protein